jgi:hypothetical protein
MNYNHHYFTNPKYKMNYICFERDGFFEIHEKSSYDGDNNCHQKLQPSQMGSPIARATTVDDAIALAVELGIKHYDIEMVVV